MVVLVRTLFRVRRVQVAVTRRKVTEGAAKRARGAVPAVEVSSAAAAAAVEHAVAACPTNVLRIPDQLSDFRQRREGRMEGRNGPGREGKSAKIPPLPSQSSSPGADADRLRTAPAARHHPLLFPFPPQSFHWQTISSLYLSPIAGNWKPMIMI